MYLMSNIEMLRRSDIDNVIMTHDKKVSAMPIHLTSEVGEGRMTITEAAEKIEAEGQKLKKALDALKEILR